MKKCFVISPIGQPNSSVREHADEVFDFIVKPAAEKAGYVAIRADHEARPGTITEHMYDHILGDDLLVAILTGFNPNVFYEVAVAECAARPLILLIQEGEQLPFDINTRRVLHYDLKIRSYCEGTYRERLYRSILDVEASIGATKVPFRPGLRPLGDGDALWRLVERSVDIPRENQIELVQSARSFVWYQGLALFSFAKIGGLEEAIEAALKRGVEVRVLIMDPANTALAHMIRNFSSNYVDNVRSEVAAGIEFWTRQARHGSLSVRLQTTGAMFGMLQQSDLRAMFTQYSLVRPTSDSPTLMTPNGTPFYEAMRTDFEWQWAKARPVSEPFVSEAAEPTPGPVAPRARRLASAQVNARSPKLEIRTR